MNMCLRGTFYVVSITSYPPYITIWFPLLARLILHAAVCFANKCVLLFHGIKETFLRLQTEIYFSEDVVKLNLENYPQLYGYVLLTL